MAYIGHHVSSRILLPHLHRKASEGPLPHAIVDKFAPARIGIALRLKHCRDFFPFCNDKRVITVTASLYIGEGLDSLLGTVDLGKPSRRARKKWQSNDKEDTRNELYSPGGPERGISVDVVAAISYKVHDQNTPF